jgi:DNA-binding GntR family transcriptional regulator
MSIQNVKEIYDLIAVLEGYAIEIAAKNFKSQDEKKLRVLQNDLEEACNLNNYKKWLDKNAIFHAYLVKASGNEFLYSMLNSLRNRIYRFRLISLTLPDSVKYYYSDHEEILKYLSQKDGKKAGKAMQRHVSSVGNNLIKFLKQIPGF